MKFEGTAVVVVGRRETKTRRAADTRTVQQSLVDGDLLTQSVGLV